MDAISMLERDHRSVERQLKELEDTTERATKGRQEGLTKLKNDLRVHEAIEEEIFYPALKEHAEAREIVLEAYEEHDVVDTILSEIETTPPEDETWAAKFSVMKENLEHHIEEEESEMFPKARDVMTDDDLEALGEDMKTRRDELTSVSTG